MKLSERIEVPELDELRLARIERNIVAEVSASPPIEATTRGSRWRGALAFAAVAGVVLAIAFNLRGSRESSQVARLQDEPTQVVTGKGQSSRLRLGDAVVDLGPDTSLTVQRHDNGRVVLQLAAGAIHCEVEPRAKRPSFQVTSGDVTVSVIGTGFDVERGRTVQVRVQHGIVGVETSRESVRLEAGQEWQGSPHANQSLAMLLQEDRDEEDVDPSAPQTPSQDPDQGKDATGKTSEGQGKHKNSRDGNGKAKGKGKHGNDGPEKPVLLSEILKGAKPLPPIFKKSYNPDLAKLEEVSSRDPRAAVKRLEALAATSTGKDASFALYSRAYLLFFRLHQNQAAITAATQYARRFPKGPEAEDMLWLRVRASCEKERSSSCRAAAHTYLRKYPSGVFAQLCARIVKTSGQD